MIATASGINFQIIKVTKVNPFTFSIIDNSRFEDEADAKIRRLKYEDNKNIYFKVYNKTLQSYNAEQIELLFRKFYLKEMHHAGVEPA